MRYQGISAYFKRLIARDISASIRYFDQVYFLRTPGADSSLWEEIEHPARTEIGSPAELAPQRGARSAVILDGSLNHSFDVEGDLAAVRGNVGRHTRVFAVVYNSHLLPLYQLFRFLGLRKAPVPVTFLTMASLGSIAELAGFKIVRARNACIFPWRLLGAGDLINRWLPAMPLVKWASFCSIVVLRPKILPGEALETPSLTIVVPARNERGNIEPLFARLPEGLPSPELVFVEGHSNDATWEEILRCEKLFGGRFRIKCLRQEGKGKADAVRLGLAHATSDLVTILDADLTMPPELLTRYYEAYRRGEADFINGNRLTYPMEGRSMRFLNNLGNRFFARALSFVLDTYLGDTLCGSKLLARHDYERILRWKSDFGDFDPFGDFELLFGAAVLGLGIIDIPIRYRARTYGTTNISRFRHGFELLRMVAVGLFRVKLLHV